ncbi:MAG TPA: class II fructose-bisphosphate aldolase [Armatimonadota bacterium]|nr:class II fructose-bisphosphate aldolase [Armatimonadota bacterium]
MRELLNDATARGYAVPSFCVWNAETARTVLMAAEDLRAPVILMGAWGELLMLPPADMAAVVRAIGARCSVPFSLHLDHGHTLELVNDCLRAGYSSVMLDFSAKPIEENTEALRAVVEMARPHGASVEGELGVVGRVDHVTGEGGTGSTLTDPSMAAEFVAATGVDALAVSIGNAHGMYHELPRLDFGRLAQLRDAVPVPLVLHGGSGTPDADLRRAISLGIAKVNVASELVKAMRESLMAQWSTGENLWIPIAQAKAMESFGDVVRRWLGLTAAEGKA